MTGPGMATEPTLLQVVTPALRHWKFVVITPLVAAVIAAGISLMVPPTYTASVTFTPASSASNTLPSGLAGLVNLAGQLGVSAGGPAFTPEFSASVLKSRELLEATLRSQFADPGSGGSPRPLLDILAPARGDSALRLYAALRRLRGLIGTVVEQRTGIVTLSARSRHQSLPAAVANRMAELLNQFNLERLQSQSREQRRFVAQRLADAERDLRDAEQALLRFLQANRQYRGSPLLEFEATRLERAVQLKQEVYITLTKAHEDARIAEVRDTPVLTIIDQATPPPRRSSPHRKLYVLVGTITGAFAGIGLAFLAHARASVNESRPDVREFRAALDDAGHELRSLLRRPLRR